LRSSAFGAASATESGAPRITFGEFMLRILRNHCRFAGLVNIAATLGLPDRRALTQTPENRIPLFLELL
jgi:hypothetical protein